MKQLVLTALLSLITACALNAEPNAPATPSSDVPGRDAGDAGPACAPNAQDRCTPGCSYPLDTNTPVLGCRPNTYVRVCSASGQLLPAPQLVPGCDCEDGCGPDAHPSSDELVAEVDRIRWTSGPSTFAGFRFFVGTPLTMPVGGSAGHWRDIVFMVTNWDPYPVRVSNDLMGHQALSWNVYRRAGTRYAFDVQRGFADSLNYPIINSVCTTRAGFPELGQVDAFRMISNATGAFDHEEALRVQRNPWPPDHPELGWCFFSIER